MAYLQYDIDAMEATKREYENCVKEMRDLQKNMKDMVKDVKSGWKSEAGDAFFDKYNNEWLTGFTQYTEVLEHMAMNLDVALNRYSELTRAAEKLSVR